MSSYKYTIFVYLTDSECLDSSKPKIIGLAVTLAVVTFVLITIILYKLCQCYRRRKTSKDYIPIGENIGDNKQSINMQSK